MADLKEKIENEYKNVYGNSKNPMTIDYVKPKIYHGGKNYDLKKRWYVYYSYRNPETGKMKRQTPITLSINRNYKTKKERMKHLRMVREILENLLKEGMSPYHYDKPNYYSCEACLDYALSLKKKQVAKNTYNEYRYNIQKFKQFLHRKNMLNDLMNDLTKQTINEYLNIILHLSLIHI